MDEALARVAIDLGGRPYCVFDSEFATPRAGGLGTDLIFHLFESLAFHGRLNLHARVLYGRNDHHKSRRSSRRWRARSMRRRSSTRGVRGVPSTKGTLTI